MFDTAFAGNYLTLKYFAGTNALSSYLTDVQRRQMGFTLNEMMLSCTYNLETCTSDDFEWYFDPIYG